MKQYNVPMELMGNILMLDVSLWSKKVNRFRNMMLVFDTGASVTTISKDILYQLGYDISSAKKTRITTASGIAYVDIVTIEKIKIGELIIENLEVYAHSFPEESFSVGVIGLNLMIDFNVLLDFQNRQIIWKEY
ncbi:MAG: hypothetical protein ATN35_02595 [Epulopiscium sp. Nele67-Bin004]|nr:MAG: hypothetical protein ATN35_02595 [Epulopiscium sp. Nele67-Bin004]